ncbi:MAG TPA: RNA ligase family protein [Kofleriaceae bacterium]|nr:RNA ligase family protein [Kofleriaceae bacterium]
MRFRTYPKIGGNAESAGGAWVATEKLHGANFVVGVAGDEVWFGKRKVWLVADDAFFGWQLIAPELGERARHVARAAGAAQVVCYGELFGGGYPHPDVPAIAGLSPVQTGVWYAPDLQWAMFDVLVAADDGDDGELLAFREVEGLAAEAGVATAPVIARGRRDELERIAVAAPTEIPVVRGLPAIANNLREGYVLKPDRRFAAGARPIVKRKLPDFDDARFDEAASWNPGYLGVDELVAWAARLVNPARVASARSKVGTARAAIVDEIVLDVAVDLETVFAASWRALAPADEARVLAAVRDAAQSTTSANVPE